MDIYSVILTKIFNLSITASITILAVLMLRLLLCKAPKRFSYLLWGIVLFRLLCPISFSSPVSLWNLTDLSVKDSGELNYFSSGNSLTKDSSVKTPAATDDPFSHDSMVTEKKQLASAESVIDPDRNASVKSVMEQYKNNNFLSSGNTTFTNTFLFGIPISFCFAIWLLGAICLAGSGIISALRLNSQLKCSMKIRENIYLADDIATPFVYGLLHPKIYLPSNLGEQEQSYIILHEQHHIHRRDHLLKLLAFAALCLHWFNPLVWLAFVLSGKDMEMSCDEAVMRKMNHDIKSEYAQSLLSLAVGRRRIIGSPLSFGENDIKSRIKNVMHYKKPKLIILAIAIIVCMIGTASLITNPTAANLTGNLLQSVKGFQDTMIVNKEDAIKKHEQPLTAEEEKAIKNVIMNANESDYPDEYDYLYRYHFVFHTNNKKTYNELIYLGNFNVQHPKDGFLIKDKVLRVRICNFEGIQNYLIESYENYNLKKSKIYDSEYRKELLKKIEQETKMKIELANEMYEKFRNNKE